MGFQATEQVIRDRFEARWSVLRPSVPYTYDNQGELNAKTPDEPWARVTILPGASQQVEMGNCRRWRRVGVVIIQFFLPTGSGTGDAAEYGDTVRDIFEGRTISGVIFRATSLERSQVDGTWLQYNCSTSFQADELR